MKYPLLALALIGTAWFFCPTNTFAAAPTMTAITQDVNSNGTIDRITITFSELVDIDDGNVNDGLPSLTLSHGCRIQNADYNMNRARTLVLANLTGCRRDDTSITPTVIYTAVASCTTAMSICDNANANQMTNGQGTVARDGAKPLITNALTVDADSDGTIEKFNIYFSEAVILTDGGTDNDISLSASTGTVSIIPGSYGTRNTFIQYNVSVSATGNTAITITPTYVTAGAGSIADLSGNTLTNGATVTGGQGATPAILSAVTGDINNDGTVDRLTLTFSESVDITDGGTDNDITLIASTGTATITAGNYEAKNVTTITYVISVSAIGNTNLTIDPIFNINGAGNIQSALAARTMQDGETVTGTDGV